MKRGKVNKSISHGCFVSSIWFLAKRRFLSYVSIFYPKNAVLSHTNSIQCLFCAEFLESNDSIAVSGRSLWDLRGTHCKILDCELQTSNEDLQYVCKTKTTQSWKRWKNDVKSQKSWGQVEGGNKNAAVRIKRGLSRARSNSGVSVARSLETKPATKALFPTSPPQNQTGFPSPVTAGAVVTKSDRLTSYSLDDWIYSSKAFRCFCSFAGISNMCKH